MDAHQHSMHRKRKLTEQRRESDQDKRTSTSDYRSGFVALVGEPNVGKSTLMNSILGTKLSIISKKPQTTRRRIVGFHSSDKHQIIFFDTPGVHEPRYLLQEKMMLALTKAMADSDLIVVLTDATRQEIAVDQILHRFQQTQTTTKREILCVLNKVDLIADKTSLLPRIDQLRNVFEFSAIIPISGRTGENVPHLIDEIHNRLPVHPPYYPEDALSDHPIRFFAAEIIREKIFNRYSDEIPFSTDVRIVEYKERSEGKDFISAEIFVERESQRMILIGKNGEALKQIGVRARHDLEALAGKPIFLELLVKVREKWRSNAGALSQLGYETN